MDQELKGFLESLIDGQKQLMAGFDKVDGELLAIRTQLDRIETEGNDDVVTMLEVINGKLELTATKEDIEFLAGKLGQHDLEIDRLKRVK